MPPSLIVICGPTAAGKSGLTLDLASQLGSIIISADSRACYQDFDIGTAKPSRAEQQRVPHYLIDTYPPTHTVTLAEYQETVQTILSGFHQTASVPPFLVGGTGLYIRAIVRGLKIPRVAPQAELRSQLQTLGQVHLYDLLRQVDPESAQRIHANDEVRTLRALEVFYTTGQPMSILQGEAPPDYPILQIGLDCRSPEGLTRRIEHRTEQMFAAGFVAEVEHLCQRYGSGLPLLNTLGYAEVKQYLAGTISLAEAKAQTVLHTRQFAKRQRTWFRADPTIEWFDAEQPDFHQQVQARVEQFQKELCHHTESWVVQRG